MKSVLFVCTANMCRSPMAEGLFRALVGADSNSWRVESAGVAAFEGASATQKAIQTLAEKGIDITQHRSRPIDRALMQEFRLILVMEHRHKQLLQAEFPQYAGRVYLLSEMIGRDEEISDPAGGTLDEYRQTAAEIEKILHSGYQRIEKLAQG